MSMCSIYCIAALSYKIDRARYVNNAWLALNIDSFNLDFHMDYESESAQKKPIIQVQITFPVIALLVKPHCTFG